MMSLPEPQPGLVIRYSYLWHDESMAGQEEGLKDRPCAILITSATGSRKTMVVPITRTKPPDMSSAVLIPDATRKRLGLHDSPMWAVCSEINEFLWPGPDIRPISKTLRYDYGLLPPKLFKEIKDKIQYCANGKKLRLVTRTN